MSEIFNKNALLERVDGDEELAQGLLSIFLEHTPLQIADLHEALEAGDASRLQGQAHSLKGAAASISAEVLKEVTGDLEQAGKTGELAQAQLLLTQLLQEFEKLQKILVGHLG